MAFSKEGRMAFSGAKQHSSSRSQPTKRGRQGAHTKPPAHRVGAAQHLVAQVAAEPHVQRPARGVADDAGRLVLGDERRVQLLAQLQQAVAEGGADHACAAGEGWAVGGVYG